jgi:cytochrome P450
MVAVLSPPGPRGKLLSGNLPEFRRDRLNFLMNCARNYGDFVSIRFGPRRVLLVFDPAAIEYVLVTGSRHFIKHFALRLNPLVLGNGLLTSEGDFWLRQRRLAQPAFQRQRILAYADTMVAHTQRMLAAWRPGETRDIMPEMSKLTLAIAAKTLFGADVTDEGSAVGNALAVTQRNFIARFNSLLPLPMYIPTPRNIRTRRAVRRLDEIIYRFIKQGRNSDGEQQNLLSLLLHARDEDDGTGMTDKQLRDEAMTLFLAGHETTALTLTWTWYLLAEHPAVQDKLAAEVDRVLDSRPATANDLPQLLYTEHIIMESLRLYPPAYTIGREAIEDCEVGGYRVPAGRTVLLPQWVVHRDPRYYDDPERFEPDRWDTERVRQMPKYAYFPFGGGPRICIGNTFAMMESVLILATVAQQYRFTVAPGHPVVPWPSFTLRPQYGIKSVLTTR